VAIALTGLLAFSALAIDYGVLWASRRQAQNAADAAALAAAVSLAVAPVDLERARAAATAFGVANPVWGEPPAIDPARDVTFAACLPGQDTPHRCVRVDVYRNQQRANPLPTFFARLVGVNEQGVRATATAQVVGGNLVRCGRPWAVPDKWWDVVDTAPPVDDNTWTADDAYERRVQHGPNRGQLLNPRDAYIPPGGSDPDGLGREYPGFRPNVDTGTRVVLAHGNAEEALRANWFFPLDLPGEGPGGGAGYRENIARCNSLGVSVGDTVENEPGDMTGPTREGVDELIAQDSGAFWDTSCTCIRGSAYGVSPRMVPIFVFSADEYDALDRQSGRFSVRIVKIMGLFVEPMQGNDVVGRIMPIPGEYHGRAGDALPPDPTTFLYTVMLAR
jgi:hypothetical protein